MNRKSLSIVVAMSVVLGLLGSVHAQSLGEQARELRKQKRSSSASGKVYTNESLGLSSAAYSVAAPAERAAAPDAEGAPKKDGATASGQKAEEELSPAEAAKKLADEWSDKISKAKAEIATMERELDIFQRENRLRAATFYADAGNRLRDEAKYAASDRQYQSDIQAKQKAIADAKANLERMRDEARRAGVPAGQIG